MTKLTILAVVAAVIALGARRWRGQHRSPTRADYQRYDAQPYS